MYLGEPQQKAAIQQVKRYIEMHKMEHSHMAMQVAEHFLDIICSLIVEDSKGMHSIYRIGIFRTTVLVNNTVYGNRSGNTYLTVAVDNSGISTSILQLNIDQYFKYFIVVE